MAVSLCDFFCKCSKIGENAKLRYQTQRCDWKSDLEVEKNTIIEGECALDIKLAQMGTSKVEVNQFLVTMKFIV